MKTNLIFKRSIEINGQTKVVTRIVPVEVPSIESGEGWTLQGHTDNIEVPEGVYVHHIAPPVKDAEQNNNAEPEVDVNSVTKFISSVQGGSKLVRTKDGIKIAARKGKTTFNQTTRNNICITMAVANEFFRDCRSVNGNTGNYVLTSGRVFDKWNAFMDFEFVRQRQEYIKNLNKKEN